MIMLIKRPVFIEFIKQNPTVDLYLIVAIVYLFVLFGGAYFVRLLLDAIPSTEKQEEENASKGKLIGVLERALLLTLWITGNTGGVAIVLTAKSIARFKEFDNKDFAEYYLIGTLTSTLIAILGGLFVQVFL
jgi:Kef-type K+ transport system membrane component KefB